MRRLRRRRSLRRPASHRPHRPRSRRPRTRNPKRRRPIRQNPPARRDAAMTTEDDELEQGKMPLLDHLLELRNRLMYSAIAVAIAFAFCYVFKENIYAFLARPLAVALE